MLWNVVVDRTRIFFFFKSQSHITKSWWSSSRLVVICPEECYWRHTGPLYSVSPCPVVKAYGVNHAVRLRLVYLFVKVFLPLIFPQWLQ